MPERWRAHPSLERIVVSPSGDDQPGIALVCGPQQLEALESWLVVDRTGTRRKPASQLVAAIGGHGDRIDLDDAHRASS